MSTLFSTPKAPIAPPPPPSPAAPASPSVMEQGASERQTLSSAAGEGFSGTDLTGGQGAAGAGTGGTTKSLLGS